MDIEHPDIAKMQRYGYLPQDERFAEDDLFERMLEDKLDRINEEEL